MRLTGTVLSETDRSGTFTGDDGQPRAWAHTVVSVLDGDEVVRVKVKADGAPHDVLQRGDEVDWQVEVAANTGQRGAYLSTTYLGDFATGPALVGATF